MDYNETNHEALILKQFHHKTKQSTRDAKNCKIVE